MIVPDPQHNLTRRGLLGATRLWRRYAESALRLLEDIRQDPRMAEVLIEGTEYIRAEIHHAARREMIVKLDDFLRRRSKVALIARTETIRRAPGLAELCGILFGDEAEARMDEYFESKEAAIDSAASSRALAPPPSSGLG